MIKERECGGGDDGDDGDGGDGGDDGDDGDDGDGGDNGDDGDDVLFSLRDSLNLQFNLVFRIAEQQKYYLR